MAKFNENATNETRTENLAGGYAYQQTKELEFLSLLLTSFGSDQYYRSTDGLYDRLSELINECDKEFVAKAIIYARTKFGMRTVTHIATSILAKYIGGKKWAKDFFDKVIYRPDDLTEIYSFHKLRDQKLSNAMKKGFAKALGRFDSYQLAKYKNNDKKNKLVDIVNLVHPVETEKNEGAIGKLVNNTLKSFDTWENELSAAGSDPEKKKAVWIKLLSENKLGYFALLRNIRNIVACNDQELSDMAYNALIDENAIKKSLVLPFRYETAYSVLQNTENSESSAALRYINKACDISCKNVPHFNGKTLIAIDESGSMGSFSDPKSPNHIAAVFGAILAKSNNADVMLFANNARYLNYNPDDSVLTLARQFQGYGGGTDFDSVFEVANKKYDRIILLSDMQSWGHLTYGNADDSSYRRYCGQYNSDAKFYSFDLAGYGTMLLPEKNVFCLAGFSDKIFDIMSYLETDKDALLNSVKSIEL